MISKGDKTYLALEVIGGEGHPVENLNVITNDDVPAGAAGVDRGACARACEDNLQQRNGMGRSYAKD